MKEDLIQFIWQHKYLLQFPLYTTNAIPIKVIKPGNLNKDSGPDFFNAQIYIDKTLWIGNVEIHLKSSDWIKHGHQLDAAYNNVILHVVWENDIAIYNESFQEIPTLEIKKLMDPQILENYEIISKHRNGIPCNSIFEMPTQEIWHMWLERIAIERLESKHQQINLHQQELVGNWELVFFKILGKAFGQKTNSIPFEILCNQELYLLLMKYKGKILSYHSIILGSAGFLEQTFSDEYLNCLKKEFDYLKKKHTITKMEKSAWKFGGVRPTNFPTIRLLQFANLYYQKPTIFIEVIKCDSLKDVKELFQIKSEQTINVNQLINEKNNSKPQNIAFSDDFINSITINTIIPFLFTYRKYFQKEESIQNIIEWLNEMPAETNKITKEWKNMGVSFKNAKETQALIQLKNYYCNHNHCLQCAIGNHLLKPRI